MSVTSHDRLTHAFSAAIGLGPSERERFVDEFDVALRDELRGLLRFHDTLDGPDLSPASLREWLAAPPPELPAGTMIGRYRIDHRLGRGGHGAVYAATQLEPIERDVALKLLDVPEPLTTAGRFAAERNAMAMLNHPGLAQIYDAGTDDAGRSFIAMERVDGEPIHAWAARCRPTTEQLVRVILQAADALEHAHARGVIHRDVKPSNLLVRGGPGDATVKTIDFGLVSAEAGSRLRRWLDDNHAAAGTPLFMSPRQATPDAPPEVQADVYGLGAVLHLLLTGSPPLDLSDLADASAAELFAAARDRSRKPTITPSHDLAAVVDKALCDRSPYGSMTVFADDLRRWLRHEPVLAREAPRGERAKLFVRRHRFGVAVAAAVSMLVIAGLVGTSIGLVRAKREARRADAAAERARTQLAASVAVARFFTTDMTNVATSLALGRDAKFGDVVARVEKSITPRFGDHPRIEAELQLAVGEMNSHLHRYDAAVAMLTRSRELFASLDPPDATQLARADASLALVLIQLHRLDEGIAAAREALRAAEGGRALDEAQAVARLALAIADDDRRHFDDALAHLDTADAQLAPWTSELGNRPLRVDLLNWRAVVLDHAGRIDQASAAYEKAMTTSAEWLGPDHPHAAVQAASFAADLLDRSRPADARPLLERSVPIIREAFGPGDAVTLGAVGNLVSAISLGGDQAKALPLAIALEESVVASLGPKSEEAVRAANRVAVLYLRLGDHAAEAIVAARRASDAALEAFGERNPLTALCVLTLGYAQAAHGDIDDAAASLRHARDIYARTMGTKHPQTVQAETKLASVLASTRPTR